MKITKQQIMDLGPCYNRQRIDKLAAGRDSIDHTEIACLPIPWKDKIWVLTRLMTPSQQDCYARRVALDVVDLWSAPQVVIDWLRSGDKKLRAAAARAAMAAWATARAAWVAADAAADAAARATARAAARSARSARAAARSARSARAAARSARSAAAVVRAADARPYREDTYLQWAAEELSSR